MLKIYGITEETPEGENLQAQAPQAHEGESPQEASALQVVSRFARFDPSRRAAGYATMVLAGSVCSTCIRH
jgi:hypothetical protein